jgi:hypothetical protein
MRLDLGKNTSRYVSTQSAQDGNGYVWVQLGNRSSLPIRNIELTYAWVDVNGRSRQNSVVYRGPLTAGSQDRVRLDLQLPTDGSLANRFRVEATGGALANS